MKKTKFIAGALVLSMGLLGTGYAYWTDALTVNTTVSTGILDVDWTDGRVSNVVGNELIKESDGKVTETKKGIDLKVENIYPGKLTRVDAYAINQGTIPAKIKAVTLVGNDVDGKTGSVESLNGKVEFAGTLSVWNKGNQEAQTEFVVIEKADTVEAFAENINTALKGKVLEPTREAILAIDVKVKETSGNETQDKDLNLSVKVDWTQENDPMVEAQ